MLKFKPVSQIPQQGILLLTDFLAIALNDERVGSILDPSIRDLDTSLSSFLLFYHCHFLLHSPQDFYVDKTRFFLKGFLSVLPGFPEVFYNRQFYLLLHNNAAFLSIKFKNMQKNVKYHFNNVELPSNPDKLYISRRI